MTPKLPRSLTGPVGLALVELARPEGPVAVEPIAVAIERGFLDVLSGQVFEHRLDGPFVQMLTELGLGVPEGHRHRLAENRIARMRISAALARVAVVLDTNSVEWAVVKGPIITNLMRCPQHRGYNDLDLVVAGDQLGRALDALIASGAEELNQNWVAYLQHRVGEVPMSVMGAPVDLHWSLVGLGRWRDTMRLDTKAMLRRRVPVRVHDSIAAWSLDEVDALLHLCVHAAMSGAGRLDQLRDIAVMVAAPTNLDWDELARRARYALIGPLVAHALDRSAIVLGAPVPVDVAEQIGGTSVRIRRYFDSKGSPELSVLRGIPVLAARDTFTSRWRARRVLIGERLGEKVQPDRSWDFANPSSVLYQGSATGGEAARRAFIESAR